jgi:hypothetical protein
MMELTHVYVFDPFTNYFSISFSYALITGN